jgi:phage-related protein
MKRVNWIGSSYKDFVAFPDEVQNFMGFVLYEAQCGKRHRASKPLKGFAGTSVVEIMDDYDGDTYRAIYTVKYSDFIYVLHAFQKKSKSGIKTPKQDIDLIRQRLKQLEEFYTHAKTAGKKP